MASFSQPSFISSLLPIKNNNTKQATNFKNSRSRISSSSKTEESSQENPPESKTQEQDPVKLAFAKAKAYKNTSKNDEIKGNKDVPLALKLAMEKAKKYKDNKILQGAVPKIVQNSGAEIELIKKNGEEVESGKDDGGGQGNIPSSIKLALEKANDYKKNKSGDEKLGSGLKEGKENIPEVKKSIKSSSKKDKLSISNIDFVGLGFADKKSGRSLPAGLVPFSDPYPQGDIPEVEILVGNSSNFGDALAEPKPTPVQENDDDELYKPKVSTWGLFPRPNDISKAYGGGRTLRPGQALETAEERAAKEARTKQLLAAYKKKYGLNIDPKLKSECEK
ncbi:hypothetical protein ACP275_02G122600 [Erythranthe tilingii]